MIGVSLLTGDPRCYSREKNNCWLMGLLPIGSIKVGATLIGTRVSNLPNSFASCTRQNKAARMLWRHYAPIYDKRFTVKLTRIGITRFQRHRHFLLLMHVQTALLSLTIKKSYWMHLGAS